MSHLWMKKNPFMSLWLSTANRVAGSVRSQAAAQAKKRMNAAMAELISPPAQKPRAKPKPKAQLRRPR